MKTSVILPTIRPGLADWDCNNIASRMYLEKPQKWYMAGSIFGEKDYNFPVSTNIEKGSVVDIESDCFIVERMECIAIDRGKWKDTENCETCIFVNNCVKGKG